MAACVGGCGSTFVEPDPFFQSLSSPPRVVFFLSARVRTYHTYSTYHLVFIHVFALIEPQSHMWGQTSQIPSSLSPKRDCGPEKVNYFGPHGYIPTYRPKKTKRHMSCGVISLVDGACTLIRSTYESVRVPSCSSCVYRHPPSRCSL